MDPILYWNDVALEANRRDFTDGPPEQGGPTLSSRALAIVHLAMYDAYAGARGNPTGAGTATGGGQLALPAYLAGLPTPTTGASAAAAVAEAAHVVLSVLYPRQQPQFDAKLTTAPLGTGNIADGLAWGRTVADHLLALRKSDPGAGSGGYVPSSARAHHRVDPANPTQGFHAPYFGAVAKCFAVTTRHSLSAPPKPGDARYLKELREVRAKGIATELSATVKRSDRRTPDQTLSGIYWAYDGAKNLGTPPRLYNQIVRKVAEKQLATLTDQERTDRNARLFALVNVSMGDAGILAWQQKYVHDLWRPVVGIREHDVSMGPAAGGGVSHIDDDCDTQWLPLGAPKSNEKLDPFTPPFPAYPSGHATFGAAALHITRRFFGVAAGNVANDHLADGLTFVSDECNGTTTDGKGVVRPRHSRQFAGGLWDMILENSASRVYLGVHWRFDGYLAKADGSPDIPSNIGGVPLGLKIANDVFDTHLHQSTV